MDRITQLQKSVFGAAGSTTDTNRLYSILLDTRASSMSENMYDIAERLMKNEKDNAKNALEQLWSLKKNLCDTAVNGTVEMLIAHYQQKLDILRDKEEHIKKVSKDSRELLEEKRKRETEISLVTQEITECSKEVDRLSLKMKELKVKEQELCLIGSQVDKELQLNANEVVNGLYEIILPVQEQADNSFSLDKELPKETANTQNQAEDAKKPVEQEADEQSGEHTPVSERAEEPVKPAELIETVNNGRKPGDTDIFEKYSSGAIQETVAAPPFPKSVVKTTKGVVLGEYYYDAKVYKNKRHYIYNSDFFHKQVGSNIIWLIRQYDQQRYGEVIQIIQDAYKRITDKSSLHFEVSTNEILNRNVLKDLVQKMVQRQFIDVQIVCNRLKAKIDAMGNNYFGMLKEQMARFLEQ